MENIDELMLLDSITYKIKVKVMLVMDIYKLRLFSLYILKIIIKF